MKGSRSKVSRQQCWLKWIRSGAVSRSSLLAEAYKIYPAASDQRNGGWMKEFYDCPEEAVKLALDNEFFFGSINVREPWMILMDFINGLGDNGHFTCLMDDALARYVQVTIRRQVSLCHASRVEAIAQLLQQKGHNRSARVVALWP